MAGLGDPHRRNWYGVDAEDLLSSAWKLGVSREKVSRNAQPFWFLAVDACMAREQRPSKRLCLSMWRLDLACEQVRRAGCITSRRCRLSGRHQPGNLRRCRSLLYRTQERRQAPPPPPACPPVQADALRKRLNTSSTGNSGESLCAAVSSIRCGLTDPGLIEFTRIPSGA